MNTENTLHLSEALGEIAFILEELRTGKNQKLLSQLLTIEESANYLNVSTDLIRKWVFQKKIKSYRLGKCVRLKRLDLESCIN
jgi:excisionase family DNA binding protein